MSTSRPFHHGDLKTALARSAVALIERSGVEVLSVREVARLAGVSSAAPYRHYPTKDALLAEVARVGFGQLHDLLVSAGAGNDRKSAFLAQSVAYLRFAEGHPALYRLMFGSFPDKHQYRDLVEAGNRLFSLLDEAMGDAGPRQPARAVGCWAFIHGLSMLALDGQLSAHLPGTSDEDIMAILRPMAHAYLRG